MRICHIDQTEVGDRENCPTCLANFPNRRDAKTMSWSDRQQEFRLLLDILEIPFNLVHKRIEELMGRPVWSHELVSSNLDKLFEEIASHEHPTMQEIIDLIPEEKRLIIGGLWQQRK